MPEIAQSELLKELQSALNTVRRTKLNSEHFKDTYALAAELDRHLREDNPANKVALVEAARREYETDTCEIDDDARISRADEDMGHWVQAWVWISTEDLEAT